MSNRGRERLRIIRAREHREFERILGAPVKRRKRNWAFYRAFEISTSLKLCDVVRQISRDGNTASLAGAIKIYWQKEYVELIAHISEQQADVIARLSEQMAKALFKWLA